MKALLIADGPSRNSIDLYQVYDIDATVGTHRCLDPGFDDAYIPTYMFINDADVMSEQYQAIRAARRAYGGPYMVLAEHFRRRTRYNKVYAADTKWFDLDYLNGGKVQFAERGPLNIYANNSGVMALQWLYQQGFTNVGIIGMDLYYPKDRDSHGFGDGKARGASDVCFVRALKWFATFRDMFRQDRFRVYNLNPDTASPLHNYLDYKEFGEWCDD